MGGKGAAIFTALIFALIAPPPSVALQAPDGESVQAALENYEETGKTRVCLQYTKIESFSPITTSDFLFVERGDFYINTTLSPCEHALNPELKVLFKRNGPQLCKNGLIHFIKGGSRPVDKCTLGEFREIALQEKPSN